MPNPTTQAYAELQTAFDHFNRELFDGALPSCLITLQREKRTYGYFSSKRFIHRSDKSLTDEIAMNPAYFAVIPIIEVMQTLVHEMAHAWQQHFGSPGRRGYHNREWATKMENIGLMPSSTGAPGGAKTGEKMADYPIEGGRFMAAAEKLLTQDFQVSWLDRHAIRLPAQAGVANGADEAELAELGALLVELDTGSNRSNRVKFRCPTCGAQAWGKPQLKLLCGEADCEGELMLPVA